MSLGKWIVWCCESCGPAHFAVPKENDHIEVACPYCGDDLEITQTGEMGSMTLIPWEE